MPTLTADVPVIEQPYAADTWIRLSTPLYVGPDRWAVILNTTRRSAHRGQEAFPYSFENEERWCAMKMGGDSPVAAGNANYDHQIIRVNAYPGRDEDMVLGFLLHEVGHAFLNGSFGGCDTDTNTECAAQLFAQVASQLPALLSETRTTLRARRSE